jgi:hypothetical protein
VSDVTRTAVLEIANTVAAVSWLLVAVLPRRRLVTDVGTAKAVPALCGRLHVGPIVPVFGRVDGGFSSRKRENTEIFLENLIVTFVLLSVFVIHGSEMRFRN